MNVGDLFDQCATVYDRDRRKLIPAFDEFYGAALCAIPFATDRPIRVLDLGAGTGLFAAMVARKFPGAELHLTDISRAMLAQAERRFAGNSRVHFSLQDHLALCEESSYDLVLSALSIHHMEHADKKALFEKVYAALCPGGLFVNADQALAPSAEGEEQYEKQWLADVRANGIAEEVLQQAQTRTRADRSALLIDQLRWLEEAGFERADCWYKRFRFAVYGAYKGQG